MDVPTPAESRFQILSDIHLESLIVPLSQVVQPAADTLIVAGDLGRVENWDQYSAAVRELCRLFRRVLLVPGNHEYLSTAKAPPLALTMQEINAKLQGLAAKDAKCQNLTVLQNSCVIVDNVLVFGATFWSYCPSQHYPGFALLTQDDKGATVPITAHQYNAMHFEALAALENAVARANAKDMRLLVVTHYAPSFRNTLAAKHAIHGTADPKNYLYCSAQDVLLENRCILAWIYGHTGHIGREGKLVSNQVGKPGFLCGAVLKMKHPVKNQLRPIEMNKIN
jgi:hypothetical protein